MDPILTTSLRLIGLGAVLYSAGRLLDKGWGWGSFSAKGWGWGTVA